ncbi:hypothetical protein KP509_14G007800 [Ceratopteris richardii]|uniref:Secreted protein n=1 Tax=Ceratopteris richardii TaxID=49495 RepID=A0A8T2TC36_CERRI|nr:hypothetical protein KP509_14G007800 [Ceratopteris richardii]
MRHSIVFGGLSIATLLGECIATLGGEHRGFGALGIVESGRSASQIPQHLEVRRESRRHRRIGHPFFSPKCFKKPLFNRLHVSFLCIL